MITPDLLVEAHKITAIPAMVIFGILVLISNLAISMFVVKKSRDKVMLIWFLTLVFAILIGVFLAFSPTLIQTMAGWFK